MKRKIIAGVLVLICCVLGFLCRPDPSYKQVLPDGTVLVLSGVKVGSSNVYSHGTALSKLFGRLTPSNGMKIARINLQRPQYVWMPAPEGSEILTAELRLGPGSPREKNFLSPPFYRKHRWLISGDDDSFVFVKELNDFKALPDGQFSLLWAWSYPKDSRVLHFRLEERDTQNTRDWKEVAAFDVKNPRRARVEPWRPSASSRLKLAEGLEVELGEMAVRHQPVNTNDIWEYTGFLPVRIFREGQLATNWGIQGGTMRDASGNYDSFSYNFTKFVTNDWTTYRIHRPIDPSKVWKFHLDFARDTDFPASNIFRFAVPWPLGKPIQTNFNGTPVTIETSRSTMLSVQLTNKPSRLRVTFISAVDDDGKDMNSHTGSWNQHGFWKMLNIGPKGSQVHATVVIHENYEADFALQPRDEGKSGERKK